MRKASFSVEKVTSHTIAHNTREDAPKYLIGLKEGRENLYKEFYSYEKFQKLAEARYVEVNKQKMQSSQKENLFEEALISLEEHHTEEDVLKLFVELKKKYTGHTLINLAIHNDEGHFVRDGIEYYPTKHILQKEDSWYILDENDAEILEALKDKDFKPKAEDFKVKVDINTFEKVYNFHAHAVFSRFDLETGKNARFQKSTMSERYKFVAEQMKMKYAPDENRLVKKTIHQHKADLSAIRNAKLVIKKEIEAEHSKEILKVKKEISTLKGQVTKNKNEKEKLKEANKALEMQLKELNTQLQSQLSNREQHAEREALVKELKEELKAKTLTAETMQTKFAELEEKLLKEKSHLTSIIEVKEIDIIDLKNQNKSLEAQKEVLASKVTDLEEKINSRANITAPQPPISVQKEFELIKKEEFEEKEVKTGLFGTEKIKVLKPDGNILQRTWNIVSAKYNDLKSKYDDLVSKINILQKENLELKEKVRELSTKQQIQAHKKDHLKEIVEQFEVHKGDKSDSSILKESKELTTKEKFELQKEAIRQQEKEKIKEVPEIKEEESSKKKKNYLSR